MKSSFKSGEGYNGACTVFGTKLNRMKPISEDNFFNCNLSKQDMAFELSKTIQNFEYK